MAGADNVDASNFKGLKKYFNSDTFYGRRNVALATYIGLAGIGLFFYLKPKKAPAAPAAPAAAAASASGKAQGC